MQTRIKQRFDALSNWISNDTNLLKGELAVVDCGNQQIRFKVGDGKHKFSQLPFVDKNLSADSISQGIKTFAVPFGFAAGCYLSANAHFSQVLGYNAKSSSSDQFAFVWNGDNTKAIGDHYSSHGVGTFSINPLSGLSGFYIGENTLAGILKDSDAVPAIFKTVQMIKPWSDGYRLHAKITIARDDQFNDLIVEQFDTSVESNYTFLKAFIPVGIEGESQWAPMPSDGFYTEANDVPIIFSLFDVLQSLGETPKVSSQYFLRYYWYYNLNGNEHRSDWFSIAVPSNTAAGAIPADSIHRSDFYDLQQLVIPSLTSVSKGTKYTDLYSCYSETVTVLSDKIDNNAKILLEEYEYGKSYKIKFTTNDLTQVHLAFFTDEGNGPEYNPSFELNASSADYIFEPKQSYLVDIQAETIKVYPLGWHSASLSSNGDFITKEALSSVAVAGAELAVPAIFRNVQLVKPQQPEGHRLHFRGDIASDDQFTKVIASNFDSAINNNYQFFKNFIVDGVSGIWKTMTSAGFYTDADDTPASFYFADALNTIGEIPKISSQYFLRYYWYYDLDGVEHRSDQFSIAIPSNTAVGANPGDIIHKNEFYDLKQTVQPLKQTIGIDDEYDRYYVCKPTVISEISSSITGQFDVLLEDYDASQIYRMQFGVGSTNATPKFYVDYGNGPELDESLKINQDRYVFKSRESYFVEIQNDVLKVNTFGYSPNTNGGSSGPYRYPLVTAQLTAVNGSLCCLIEDHTVTTIEVSSASTPLIIKLPPKPSDNGARDFILRIEVSSSTAPGVTFAGLDETITFDSDSDDWMTIEPGLNLISFTETK